MLSSTTLKASSLDSSSVISNWTRLALASGVSGGAGESAGGSGGDSSVVCRALAVVVVVREVGDGAAGGDLVAGA